MMAFITCSMTTMVRPSCSFRRRVRPMIQSISALFRPAMTSSSSSSSGSMARARASSRRLRSEMFRFSTATSSRPLRFTVWRMERVLSRASRASRILSLPNSAPMDTFSSRVMPGKGLTTWKVREMPSSAMR